MDAVAENLCTTPTSLRCLAALRDLTGEVGGPMERHSLRVVLLAGELARLGDHEVDDEVLVCAGLLHDIGLYPGVATKAAYVTDGRRLAETMLGDAGWSPDRVRLAADAVEYHHELRAQWARGTEVELLRKADLVEVSHGVVSAGISKAFRADLLARLPRQGFVGEVARGLGRAIRDRPASLWRIAKPT